MQGLLDDTAPSNFAYTLYTGKRTVCSGIFGCYSPLVMICLQALLGSDGYIHRSFWRRSPPP
jgi:flagellar motor switch protein FliM